MSKQTHKSNRMPNLLNKVFGDINSHTPLPTVLYPSFFTKLSHVRNILLYVLVVSCCHYHIQLLYIFINTLCEGTFVHLIDAFNKRTFLVKNTFVFLKWTKIDDQASSFFIFVVLCENSTDNLYVVISSVYGPNVSQS